MNFEVFLALIVFILKITLQSPLSPADMMLAILPLVERITNIIAKSIGRPFPESPDTVIPERALPGSDVYFLLQLLYLLFLGFFMGYCL